jgi:tetratricopeptide (TPR) repeat protein
MRFYRCFCGFARSLPEVCPKFVPRFCLEPVPMLCPVPWLRDPKQLKYALLASAVAISCWGMPLSLSANGSELSRQLAIPLNNGTLSPQRREADRLMGLGDQQFQAGAPQQAIRSWLSALDLYHRLRDLEAQGRVYAALGATYADLGQFAEAEDAMRRRLGVARTLNDFQSQIQGFNNLGVLLLQRNRPDQAEASFAEGLKVAQDLGSRSGIGLSYSNLGRAAYGVRDYALAGRYFNQAITAQAQAIDLAGQSQTYNFMGDNYMALKDLRQAAGSYQSALMLARQVQDPVIEGRALDGLATVYTGMGADGAAVEYLQKRLTLARQSNNPGQILVALQSLGVYYRQKQDFINTENYYQQALAVSQAMGDQSAQGQIQGQLDDLRLRQSLMLQKPKK